MSRLSTPRLTKELTDPDESFLTMNEFHVALLIKLLVDVISHSDIRFNAAAIDSAVTVLSNFILGVIMLPVFLAVGLSFCLVHSVP